MRAGSETIGESEPLRTSLSGDAEVARRFAEPTRMRESRLSDPTRRAAGMSGDMVSESSLSSLPRSLLGDCAAMRAAP